MGHISVGASIPAVVGIVGGGVLLFFLLLLVIGIIRRKRHDRSLEHDLAEETKEPLPGEIIAEVEIIPKEQYAPVSSKTVFYPVPDSVAETADFVTAETYGIEPRDMTGEAEAEGLLPGDPARFVAHIPKAEGGGELVREVFLDTLSGRFEPYSYIDPAVLMREGMIPAGTGRVHVGARGILRKPLLVVADGFTDSAVKMLTVTGGRAVLRDL